MKRGAGTKKSQPEIWNLSLMAARISSVWFTEPSPPEVKPKIKKIIKV